MMQRLKNAVISSIILIAFFSCNNLTNKDDELSYDYDMIQVLISDSRNQILQLEDHINHNIYNEKQNITVEFSQYDSLTKLYIKVIDKIIEDLTPAEYNSSILGKPDISDAYFFSGERYSVKGNDYISKTDGYRNDILALSNDYFVRSRVSLALSTGDIVGESGTHYQHLNYYLKNMTLASTLAYFYNHKRKVLELENMYLYQTLIDKEKLN